MKKWESLGGRLAGFRKWIKFNGGVAHIIPLQMLIKLMDVHEEEICGT